MYANAKYLNDLRGIPNAPLKVSSITVDINGVTSFVPLDPSNTDYANIMKMQKEGELVIAPAEQ